MQQAFFFGLSTQLFCEYDAGDGGNEVGMGKVYDRVVGSANIPNAATIACVSAADHLLVCSVSNWGGYALSAATALASVVRSNPFTTGTTAPSPVLLFVFLCVCFCIFFRLCVFSSHQ